MSNNTIASTWKVDTITSDTHSAPDTGAFYTKIEEQLNTKLNTIHPALIKMDAHASYVEGPMGVNISKLAASIVYNDNGTDNKSVLKTGFKGCPAKTTQGIIPKKYSGVGAELLQDLSTYEPLGNQLCSPFLSSGNFDGDNIAFPVYNYMFEVENATSIAAQNTDKTRPTWLHIQETQLDNEDMKNRWESIGDTASPFCIKACMSRYYHVGLLDIFYTKSIPTDYYKDGFNGNKAAIPFYDYKGEWQWQHTVFNSADDLLKALNDTSRPVPMAYLSKVCALAWTENWQYILFTPFPSASDQPGVYFNIGGTDTYLSAVKEQNADDYTIKFSTLKGPGEKASAVWALVPRGPSYCIQHCNSSLALTIDEEHPEKVFLSKLSYTQFQLFQKTPDVHQLISSFTGGLLCDEEGKLVLNQDSFRAIKFNFTDQI